MTAYFPSNTEFMWHYNALQDPSIDDIAIVIRFKFFAIVIRFKFFRFSFKSDGIVNKSFYHILFLPLLHKCR